VNSRERLALQAVLRATAVAYGAALRLRNRLYDRPGAAQRVGVPVVSVGNLTVGGTGKTPLVGWLARHLVAAGRQPAVVSRGYRGRAGRGPLVVSDGAGPRCDAATCGDEPFLLARTLDSVRVVVGADRVAAARAAVHAGADVVVLDDGFQHRRLARDMDIVLLDASNPFGNYRLLPAGLLREPVSGLARADLVLITRSRAGERLAVIERVVRHHNPVAPILRTGHRLVGFFDDRGSQVESPARAVAFCGVGNPSRFRIDLESTGVEVVGFRAYRDHHAYAREEIDELVRLARERDAVLVTTEKDRVRMPWKTGTRPPGPPVLTLHIEAQLFEPQPLLDALGRVLARTRA
jgi:tetraacyldisaccharide 4'-kinase